MGGQVVSERTDFRLTWNAVITELNTNQIDLEELLSTAQSNELRFFRVQFETISCHP